MAKIHTTFSIDVELLEKLRKQGLNISGTVNELLWKFLKQKPKFSDGEKKILKQQQGQERLSTERHNELMDEARAFWKSPWGKEAIKKAREKWRDDGR